MLTALLLGLVLLPIGEAATTPVTIPQDLAIQLDPDGDVYQISDEGVQSGASGHGEIDILDFTLEQSEWESGVGGHLADRALHFNMTLKGNGVNTDEKVNYVFGVGTPENTYAIFCNYSDIAKDVVCYIMNLETGEPEIGLSTEGDISGNKVSVKVLATTLGSPSSIELYRSLAIDYRDDTKYGDAAPDSLVKFTSPSNGTTIWHDGSNTYTFKGACHKSTLDFASIECSINDGASWQSAVQIGGNWDEWAINYPISGRSGEEMILVKATDTDGSVFEDDLIFFVNNDYIVESERPQIPDALPDMIIGTIYSYKAEASSKLSSFDLATTTEMYVEVEKIESIDNPDHQYDCVKLHTTESGSLVFGAIQVVQTVERDSWRPLDNQQTIVKEYTETTQSVESDGSPVTEGSTFTNITYDHPGLYPGFLEARVGDWWMYSTGYEQETVTVNSSDETKTKESDGEKESYSEFLRTESLGHGDIPALSASLECYLVKNSNGDNESSYTVITYTDTYPVPVRIQMYDGNRDVIGSFALESKEEGDGTFFNIANVIWPSGDLPADEEVVVSVTVENQGTTAGQATVRLIVDGEEVGTQTSGAIVPGGTEVVELAWTPSEEGSYEMSVEVVGEGQPGTDTMASSPGLIGISAPASNVIDPDSMLYLVLVLAALAVVVVIVVAVKRRSTAGSTPGPRMEKEEGSTPDRQPGTGEVMIESGGIEIDGLGPASAAKDLLPHQKKRMEEVVGEKKGLENIEGERTPVKCSKCGSTTSVIITHKPYKFKCPDCGAKLIIR